LPSNRLKKIATLILNKLSVINFKNYEQLSLEFSDKLNCIVGNNGAGKTNLLDAIYYLSMCRSFFNNVDQFNIRYNEELFVLQGDYSIGGRNEEIICSYRKNGRKIVKRNRKEYERLSEHIGLIPVVMITPNDSILITGGSEERRKLIDTIISQYNKTYLENLIQYNRILQQRNHFLKQSAYQSQSALLEMFDVYDRQLSDAGQKIYNERLKFIEDFKLKFLELYNHIAGTNEQVSLQYQSQLHHEDMFTQLQKNFVRDRQLEYTSVGIHKDDLLLLIDNLPAKRIASQGQQKTFLVALKLAEYQIIYQYSQKKPLLLLDDIFDKFDYQRVQRLIEFTHSNQLGQIFITDTEMNRINEVLSQISNNHRVFRIEKNTAHIME
jgi:DNA replication and repair protein RecF